MCEKDDDEDFNPYDDCDEQDDFEQLADQCGSHRDGQCDLAGTEWCDWSCPLHDEVFRAAIRRARKAAPQPPEGETR